MVLLYSTIISSMPRVDKPEAHGTDVFYHMFHDSNYKYFCFIVKEVWDLVRNMAPFTFLCCERELL